MKVAKSVLVVDDDKNLAQFLKDFFGQEGYQMFTALDGPSAIEAARKYHPTLMLLDMKLPGLDGIGVLKAIRQEQPSTQVIVVTSYDEDYKRICEELGVKGFFAKPISLTDLSTKITEVLEGQDDPPVVLVETETETVVPRAKLLLIGRCALMPIKLCIPDRVSLDASADELDRAVGVGCYETADAYSVKEVREQLRVFHPDLVLISTDFLDESMTPPATAATLASEILASPLKPRDLIIFGGYNPFNEPQFEGGEVVTQKPPVNAPSLHEWSSPEFLQKAKRFSRLLREKCLQLGLVEKKTA